MTILAEILVAKGLRLRLAAPTGRAAKRLEEDGPNELDKPPRVARWAGTKMHGAFKVHFLCAQREAGMFLNISAKFWRISRLT